MCNYERRRELITRVAQLFRSTVSVCLPLAYALTHATTPFTTTPTTAPLLSPSP